MPLLPRPLWLSRLLHLSSYANATTLTCRQCPHHKPTTPLRLLIKQPSHRAPFSTSAPSSLQDHYATLDLPPTASQADIKKAFYALSKTHHPDHNPHDQEAASRKFVACSDAYATLGNPAKRQAYDRERAPASSARHASSYQHAGSYSSSAQQQQQQQPGGRPASGLSRRRGAFRGPPPSFYRSGGWGASADKRRANSPADARAGGEEDAQQRQRRRQAQEDALNNDGGFASARQQREDDGFPFSAPNDVPHFDRGGHFRRTTGVEEQLRRGRAKRRRVLLEEQQQAGETPEDVGAGTEFRNFALIGGVVFVGVGLPLVLYSVDSSRERKRARGKPCAGGET